MSFARIIFNAIILTCLVLVPNAASFVTSKNPSFIIGQRISNNFNNKFMSYHKMSTEQSAENGEAQNDEVNVLLVECGFGNDSHGQNATKAAMRACRNAIEFNSISIKKIVPGGYDAMKLNVILGVPSKYQNTLDLEEVKKVFPYGEVQFTVQDGGLIAPSGRIIESLGDKNDDMLIVCAAVQVGY